MKPINYYKLVFLLSIIILASCDDNNMNAGDQPFDEFCSVVPEGWQCSITTSEFDVQKIPQNAETHIAIIEYLNPNIEFT
jgi:hypothetical protein